jgi:hypothetical protein
MLDTSHEGTFIIAVDSGVNTVYLDPDNQTDSAPQLVQIWNEDPVAESRPDLAKVLQWHIHRDSNDDTYTIRLNPSQDNALAYTNKDGRYDGYLWILGYNPNSRSQRWHITPVSSAVNNSYVISSAENPNYGIIRQDDVTTDTYVRIRRMWGGPTPIFAWYITPVPSDLKEM